MFIMGRGPDDTPTGLLSGFVRYLHGCAGPGGAVQLAPSLVWFSVAFIPDLNASSLHPSTVESFCDTRKLAFRRPKAYLCTLP